MKKITMFALVVLILFSCGDNKPKEESSISYAKVLNPGSGGYTFYDTVDGYQIRYWIRDTTITATVPYSYSRTIVDTFKRWLGTTVPPSVDTVIVPPVTPSAIQGFGANAVGGSNSSDVRTVTTAAQFNAALGNNRTILFGANVTIKGRVNITYSYLTIDGNGYDVIIDNNNNGDGISFNGSGAHHCILKNVNVTDAGNDGINVIDGANNIAIVNCSSYGNRDGNIDVAGGKDVTVQYCILGKGGPGWSGAMLITATNVSVHHNLFVTATTNEVGERGPFVHSNYTSPGSPCADIRNNVFYNWGRSVTRNGVAYPGEGSGYSTAIGYNATGNVVNNYYHDKESAGSAVANGDGYGTAANGKIYSAGNVISNGSSTLSASMANNRAEWPIANQFKITTQTACEARASVLQKVGPRLKNGSLNATNQVYVSQAPSHGCN